MYNSKAKGLNRQGKRFSVQLSQSLTNHSLDARIPIIALYTAPSVKGIIVYGGSRGLRLRICHLNKLVSASLRWVDITTATSETNIWIQLSLARIFQ